jgi:hypothetical protein
MDVYASLSPLNKEILYTGGGSGSLMKYKQKNFSILRSVRWTTAPCSASRPSVRDAVSNMKLGRFPFCESFTRNDKKKARHESCRAFCRLYFWKGAGKITRHSGVFFTKLFFLARDGDQALDDGALFNINGLRGNIAGYFGVFPDADVVF